MDVSRGDSLGHTARKRRIVGPVTGTSHVQEFVRCIIFFLALQRDVHQMIIDAACSEILRRIAEMRGGR